MRPRFLASLWAIAVLAVFAIAGCQNPIDPIDKSDKIQGLKWVEINGGDLDRWDSDPGLDGMVITLSYKNEFGDELSFHDKAHNIVIEFWTQKDTGTDGSSYITRDQLFYSQTIEYENSDDSIRIPYEAYLAQLAQAFDFSNVDETFTGMLVVRVFPPDEDPRPELVVAQGDTVFYERPAGDDLTP